MKSFFHKRASAGLAAVVWLGGLSATSAQSYGLLREVYTGITGNAVADLTNSPSFPDHPTSTNYVTDFFEAPSNVADNYGQRMRGFIVAPQTGNYFFWIASDDNGLLYLSTDETPANKRAIADVPVWTNPREWTKYAEQQSAAIPLVAGQRYYIEALMKEGGGGDNLAVGWQLPDGTLERPIPATRLLPWGTSFTPPIIAQQPASQTIVEGQPATFSVRVSNLDSVYYQWRRGGANIGGANGSSYTIPRVALGDNGAQFSCFLTNSLGSTNSAAATLFVTPDTNAPTLSYAVNIGSNSVRLVFSEPVAAPSATTASNYKLNNGASVSSATFDSDDRTLLLITSSLSFGTLYTLTVNNVKDTAATPNTIAPNSTISFLASEFTPQDVGNPALAGSQTRVTNGCFNVVGEGADIGGTSDQLQFSYQLRTGNFDVRARLESLGLADVWTKAGLVAREDFTTTGRFAGAMATPSLSGCFFESRNPAGSAANLTGSFPANFPSTWLRLQRNGNQFTGYASYDGQTWTQLGSAIIAMPNTVYFGLAVSSHNASQLTNAQFRDVGDVTNATIGTLPVDFEPLGPSSRKTGLVISEIMYKPAPRADGKNLEYIELFNSNPFYEDLGGYQISGDISYTFPSNTVMAGGSFLVVARVPTDIESIYGITNVTGPYAGSLKGSGTVQLLNKIGAVYLDVPYENKPPWPVAADGTGHSLVLARPSYGEADPHAWSISDVVGGSPGTMDGYRPSPLRAVVINEFLAHTDPPLYDYIELYNHSNQAVDLSGCTLSDHPNTNRFVVPAGTIIPPRGFVYFDENQMGFRLSAVGETIYFKNPDGSRVLDCVQFEGQENSVSMGRWPDGAADFYPMQSRTPGTNNGPILVRDIVINEIMYHPISDDDNDQYVELYNRGSGSVDLSGWRFISGIDYTFPANTAMAPGAYLVVVKNATNLMAHYSNLTRLNTLGNFGGHLSHNGERLALAKWDQVVNTNTPGVTETNIAWIVQDEVTYGTGGRWGQWSDGGGSSLELIDPRSDHRLASNWADSDEVQKASWTNIEVTARMDNGANYSTNGINFVEVGLLGAGECLVDNVEFRPGGPASANIVANPDFEGGLSNWSPQGDHVRSFLDTTEGYSSAHSLHLRASDTMWSGVNSVQGGLTSNVANPSGLTATLRLKARWLKGWPEVLLRVHGNWIEDVERMAIPQNLGTPGARNSRAAANAGPAIYDVTHSPSIPGANQNVVVTARVQDPDGIQSLWLYYRVDPASTYTLAAMLDNGLGGDAVAGDGIYSATIPGRAVGTVVAFYLKATDALSASTRFPADLADGAPARECVVCFGDPNPASSFGAYHLWLTQNVINRWSSLPDLSNEPLDGTWVYGNRIIYNMSAHYAGSPYHQQFNSPVGNPCHYHCDMPADDKLFGTTSFNKIHAPGNGPFDDDTLQREQTAYWMVRQLDLPWNYRRYVALYVNGRRRGTLMEDAQVPNGDVIDEYFPNDTNGQLFKLQPWFEFAPASPSYSQNFINASWCTLNDYTTTGGAKQLARYRWNYLARKTGTTANDYTNVFKLIDAANSYNTANYVANMEDQVNMEEWLRIFAVEHAAGNWDSFGARNSQNMYAYKPQNGKWNLLIWDYNIVLGNSGSWGPDGNNLFTYNDYNPGDPVMGQIYANPTFRRAYLRAFKEIANGPMLATHVAPVLDAKYAAFVADGVDASSPAAIKSWIATMRNSLLSALNSEGANAPFAITSNGGNNFSTGKNFVALTGTAPVEVKTITINGLADPVAWNSITRWAADVALAGGANAITVQGLDYYGNPVAGANDTITITYTGVAEPPQGHLVINEIMYNPAAPNASFIELYNTATNTAFDLSGWRLDGVDFTFPGGSLLQPGGFLVVASDAAGFAAAYGASIPLAGVFNGRLQNNGETLKLVKPGATPAQDQIINEVTYSSAPPWPTAANGFGPSLQLIDPTQDNNRVANWSAVSQPSTTNSQNLIAITHTWKYNQTGADLGTAWRAAGYDDSAWPSGPALLYNETASLPAPKNTPLNLGPITYYFRTHFNFTNNPANAVLTLNTVIDDGAVVYLNGVEVFRLGMPVGTITYTTPAARSVGDAVYEGPYLIPAATLVAGDNVVAVEVHQWSTTSSDIVFGLTLDVTSVNGGLYTPGAPNSVPAPLAPLPLVWLNEVQPNNTNGPQDNFGERDPWVELYNTGASTVDLSCYYLSDNYTNLLGWAFPAGTTLNPGQFRLVWLDGQPGQNSGANLHAGFRASPTNGSVVLTRVSGGVTTIVDYLNYQPLNNDRSYGAFPDGTPAKRRIFYYATPGSTNDNTWPVLPVTINEFMASNTRTLADPATGHYDDWFELYNAGPVPADLAGYTLTDDLTNKTKFNIPPGYSVPASGYLLVWADNDSSQNATNDPSLHVNFALSRDGEAIGLFAPDGTAVDTVTFGPQTSDASEGCWPDGNSGQYYPMSTPTPGAANVLGSVTNQPPVLGFIADQSVYQGSPLTFTASAIDPDSGQTLTYSLDAGAPANAYLNPSSGVFTWTPGPHDAAGDCFITVRVTDDGSPPLNDAQTLKITVLNPPELQFTSITPNGDGSVTFSWATQPQRTYRVSCKTNLNQSAWIPLTDVPATGTRLSLTEETITGQQSFYRIELLPQP